MTKIIYLQSLHRPYNQNLNSVKWVCKFIEKKNSHNEISKSELYISFYIYFIEEFYNLYSKVQNNYLTHGVPTFESIQNSYLFIKQLDKSHQREGIVKALALRTNDVEKSIFSTYKASSYFLNLSKTKLKFINSNNALTDIGIELNSFKSNMLFLSKKERMILFTSVINTDFHFFVSLLLLLKIQKKFVILDLAEIHYDFLVDELKIRRFSTQESDLNFSRVREYWIKDLEVLDRNSNIKKIFLEIISESGFSELYLHLKSQVADYYQNEIIGKIKYQRRLDLFKTVYSETKKNELGFLPLYIIAGKMKMSKALFQNFIAEFYETEKQTYSIFFNNIVQSTSMKNQYLIRNRPVVNIRIKELNKIE